MLSWQAVGLTEGLPATAANRFHKELRFFFSLLKRKKEAKKEKNSRSTCTTRSNITRRLYREFSTYVKSFIFMWKPLHRLTAVPLVLSGPLCPAGISPPRGESPLSGEAFLTFEFPTTKLPRRGKQAAAAAVTLSFLQLKLGRKVSGGLLSLSKSAVAISAGRRADSPPQRENIALKIAYKKTTPHKV